MSRRALFLGLLIAACAPQTDDPSQVTDLRVLGIGFEPPELMAAKCDPQSMATFATFARPVKMTWLLEDPAGAGRALSYEVIACANQSDRTCSNKGDFKLLASGTTQPGELTLTLAPGATFVDDGPLLIEVQQQDTYRGLGGLRMPIMFHLKAGDEEIYAMKLMVFSCQFFPEMKANLNPVLPGFTFADGGTWADDEIPQLAGHPDAGMVLRSLPLDALEEPYTVVGFDLQPIALTEAWKISYYSTLGRFSPNQTGGVGFDGQPGRHKVEWKPLKTETTEEDLTMWFVVRDGRGGESWISRRAHWTP